jgi:hypothetical protein
VLADGVADLVADIDFDLRDRSRAVIREAEEAIDAQDPGPAWPELAEWLDRRIAAAVADSYVWAEQRSEWLAARVIEQFARDGGGAVPALSVGAAGDALAGLVDLPAVDDGAMTLRERTLIGLRGSYTGVLMTGLMTSLAGMAIINPVSVAAGVLLGRKAYRDDQQQRLQRRRSEAKAVVRRHLDEVVFQVASTSRTGCAPCPAHPARPDHRHRRGDVPVAGRRGRRRPARHPGGHRRARRPHPLPAPAARPARPAGRRRPRAGPGRRGGSVTEGAGSRGDMEGGVPGRGPRPARRRAGALRRRPGCRRPLQAQRRPLDEPLRLALVGRVKSGKSTLLNALVGARVAPTDAGECTRVVTHYRHGATPRVELHGTDGGRRTLPVRRADGGLLLELGGTPPEEVAQLVVDWPADDLLPATVVDTPGIASLSTGTSARTHGFLGYRRGPAGADAVVFLTRQPQPEDVAVLAAFQAGTGGRAR